MVQGSAEAFPAHFEIRSSELRPGIDKNQEDKVILRLALCREDDQDSSFHGVAVQEALSDLLDLLFIAQFFLWEFIK